MKKMSAICLIMLAALSAGCSANKTSIADAIESGADPAAVTPSPAAGTSSTTAEEQHNHFRKLRFQSLRYKHEQKAAPADEALK